MAGAREIDAAAAAWFARRDKGDWREEDQRELDAWLASDTAHCVAFLRIEAAWKQAERLKALGAGVEPGTVPEAACWNFSPVFEHPDPPKAPPETAPAANESRTFLRVMIAAAACVVLALFGVWHWSTQLAQFTEYRTAVGGLQTVPLIDGSTVILNTDSEVRVAMTDDTRKIQLPRGEAFFDVAKELDRPFIVEAGKRRIVVAGTKFSVRNEGGVILVAVTEGRVRLERAGAPPVHLQAGDIARADPDNTLVQHRSPSELEAEQLAWRRGYLVFRATPLDEVLAEFNRYNIEKVRVDDRELASIRIEGNFRVTNIKAFLRLLEQGFRIQAIQQGDELVLERKRDSRAAEKSART